jgi:Carboxypeptidase regulatory-like domain
MKCSAHRLLLPFVGLLVSAWLPLSLSYAQSTYTAQLTGVVSDSSGAVIPGAKVTLTDEATKIATNIVTDNRGVYVFTGLRPTTYSIRVEAPNLAAQERKGVVLGVNQQATLDFVLNPGTVTESVTVSETAPLLDTGNATLGTDVTNEYVKELPLINRSMFGLVFLAAGVTEVTGAGIQDPYPNGTNFVSNGQRNATAEVRIDGALTSAPEQGEGGNSNVYYQPLVEMVQEFKVENNSFSAEYGNNGGTVVNMVLKSGGNDFHGSAWWFGQRSALNANDFFSNAYGTPKPEYSRNQEGFSLGGPIRKQKTFFFIDFEDIQQSSPLVVQGTVPTQAMQNGDFSALLNGATGQQVYNPFNCLLNDPADPTQGCTRAPFAGNIIPTNMIDPVGQALLKVYPKPNLPGAINNFRQTVVVTSPQYQFDIKIDHQFSERQHFTARYSRLHNEYDAPFVVGDGTGPTGNTINDGFTGITNSQNVGLEYTFALTPTSIWVSRFGLDRAFGPVTPVMTPSTAEAVGFPSYLAQTNGVDRMPQIMVDGTNNNLSMYNQCCTFTNFAHTLYSYSSSMSLVRGQHTIKFGFEQRQFFNNFWQPSYPTGTFYFPQSITGAFPGDNNLGDGNSFATMLLGWADPSSSIIVQPSVADKSWETGFYVQDDWKLSARLTVNLGLRYEWSTPYTVRHNRTQFSDFSANTGVSVPLPNGLDPTQTSVTELQGTTLFAGQGGLGRHVPTDRNNIGPRVGFAFSLNPTTVIRGGAGVYYGMSPATNFQYVGTAFGSSATAQFSVDNNMTRNTAVSLSNPYPNGIPVQQGESAGPLALWGFDNSNNLGTEEARNADIYQWNIGVQHLFPWDVTIGVDYSANRSTHLPWGGYSSTRNRNFISSTLLSQISAQQHALDANCDSDSCVTTYLNQVVNNPFAPLFQPGPQQMFNAPASLYNQDQIPLYYLLRPNPQFAGTFQGLPNFGANSWYNAMLVRFQKRMNHYFSLEGNYTFSKATDDSSVGSNAFVGTLNLGNPQQIDRPKNEYAPSANDATHRFVLAGILDLPLGRGLWIGRDMNRVLDGFVGGWSVSGLVTVQTGQPLPITVASPRLLDGNQRPNVICSQLSSGFSYHQAASNYLNQQLGDPNAVNPYSTSVLNPNCFADPGDQNPGNAPRYFSGLRADGIRNMDVTFSKQFTVHEGMSLQLRGEFFNFTNTPRFAFPSLAWAPGRPGVDNTTFGQVTSLANSPRTMQFGLRFQF